MQSDSAQGPVSLGGATFRDDFDSGNLGEVVAVHDSAFRITPRLDCAGVGLGKTTRSWYYFGVSGFGPGQKVTFYISKVNALYSLATNQSK
jgi:hypothetical protein